MWFEPQPDGYELTAETRLGPDDSEPHAVYGHPVTMAATTAKEMASGAIAATSKRDLANHIAAAL